MDDTEIRFLAVKRKLFEKLYGRLNPPQREAVLSVNGPLLVFAGAGSGKTTVLVNRVAQIIRYGNAYASRRIPEGLSLQTVEALEDSLGAMGENDLRLLLDGFAEDPCPPRSMLAITFTNKAADEIKTRLETLLGDPELSSGVWAGTFHSVCMRMIRSNPAEAGVRPGVTIYDADDTKKLLGNILKEKNADDRQLSAKAAAALISRAKERLMTPEEYRENFGRDYRGRLTADVYSEYRDRLADANALDFDDIIMKTVMMLRNSDRVREYYSDKFRYICVDEFQDTDPAQFELVKLLASKHGNIMAVGDDDQSIYRFRGATVENILGFEKTFRDTKVIKLEQNYRSTSNILAAANAVISKNASRADKKLWTGAGSGNKVMIESCESEQSEAERIVELIQTAVARGQYRYRDFAVLYRVNAQSNALERTFSRSGLPYRIYGGQRFADRKEIRDVTAYLQLVANHSDDVRLRRIINEPKRKIGNATVEAVAAIAEETGQSMFDVMDRADSYVALSRSAAKLKEFTGVINELGRIYRSGCPLDAFIGSVLDMTGYRNMLIDGGEEEKDRLDNVDEFISSAVDYMRNEEQPTLEGFLELNALVSDIDRYDADADAAVLMTVHSAKGLEFPAVIIPGMEETVFPSAMSLDDPAEMEEERRLAYVAITRAKENLYIFCSESRLLYGKTQFNRPSRFVGDIPESVSEKRGFNRRSRVRGGAGFAEDSLFRGAYGSWREPGYGDAGSNFGSPAVTPPPPPHPPLRTASRPRSFPSVLFSPGDRVIHQAFGAGTVISVKAIGSERLYEIAFDEKGTKKLMASYAKLSPESGEG